MQFDKGPKITIEFVYEKGETMSRLFLSDTFRCIHANDTHLKWIEEYLQKKALPFPIESKEDFPSQVLYFMSKIPFGKTISYSDLAKLCNRPFAARAVGSVCRKNPLPLLIPCHRVILKDKRMGKFAYGDEVKRRLLEFEAGK